MPPMELDIFQLLLVHAKIMAKLVDDGKPDLLSDFGFGGAHRFNVFLVEDNVIRPGWQVEHALLCYGHAVEEPKKEFLWLARPS